MMRGVLLIMAIFVFVTSDAGTIPTQLEEVPLQELPNQVEILKVANQLEFLRKKNLYK